LEPNYVELIDHSRAHVVAVRTGCLTHPVPDQLMHTDWMAVNLTAFNVPHFIVVRPQKVPYRPTTGDCFTPKCLTAD